MRFQENFHLFLTSTIIRTDEQSVSFTDPVKYKPQTMSELGYCYYCTGGNETPDRKPKSFQSSCFFFFLNICFGWSILEAGETLQMKLHVKFAF